MADKSLERAIGYGVYGPSFDEAHADPAVWDHLATEQDRIVERVIAAMAANGWWATHDRMAGL